MQFIKTTSQLAELCQTLAQEEFVTIDTEFMRDRTYWPKLCLIQIAGDDLVAIIDPLADGIDLAPFYGLMRAPDVLKVVHAGRQDIEIFFHQGQTIPTPLFDTQIAAMACGFSDSVGYETLVGDLTGHKLDKSSRFSDWSVRPLRDHQLKYAAGDVTYLRDIYRALRDKLKAGKRESWLAEEMDDLTNPVTYALEPELAWKRLKLRGPVRKNLGVLVEVAAWRERQAQTRDVPRNRIIKDDLIYEIVTQKPSSLDALDNMRFGQKGLSRLPGAKDLVEAVKRGATLPPSEWPDVRPASPPKTKGNGALVELLKVLLKLTSEQNEVAQKLIANVADLEKIATDDAADVKAMTGWRRDIYGQKALELKDGRLAIAIQNGKVQTVSIEP